MPNNKKGTALGIWEHVVVTGGAGFIGSNLVLEIQKRHPEARITVVDDFRSGHFKNLDTFRGDVFALDPATIDLNECFAGEGVSLFFHLASFTDTTLTDQRRMVHDNVEAFRRILFFCSDPSRRGFDIPLVYASSGATYGIAEGRMAETTPAKPANVYGFSKMILDNLARRAMTENPDRHIVGLRYFNVYGPREAHKQKMSSMIYQLACQIKSGHPPRVFKHGEQKRDFVYVKDVVEATLLASTATQSGIYNVGSGKARSFNELIDVLNHRLGADLETEYIDNPYPFFQPFTEADLTAIETDLGYRPRYSLEEGIQDYLAIGL